PALAQTLVGADPASFPAHLSPALLHRRDLGSSLLGGPHEALPVTAPFTGAVIGRCHLGTAADVRFAVSRARQAQPAWAARPLRERAAVLLRFHDLLFERMQEGLDLIQFEGGKARVDALAEYLDVPLVARYYGLHGPDALARERRRGFVPLLTQAEVNHVPVGVVGIIAPWNFPLTLSITDALPALLAGNTVVLKPAEQTPFTALWVAQLLIEAGLPGEALHVVPGRGEAVGPALIDAANSVQFTGSTEVGKEVGRQASEALTGASLELGGKNPLIVRHDADLDRVMPGIRQACFGAAGQVCVSAERLYVHESLFDAFVDRLRASAEAMEVNARFDFSAHMGSLISAEQLERVSAHVEDAVARGATLVAGGRALPEVGPFFYAPTVLTDVRPGMALYEGETFGPVVAVYPFRTDDEAVERANATAYGLNASVWTRDVRAGRRMARRIEAGTVGVNDAYMAAWASTAAPMGGFKESGLGRRHGPEGLLKFTEAQTVAVQHGFPLAPGALGLSQELFMRITTEAIRLSRYLPGVR
ncbi:MAG: succinic semialdehyde dehydrogenase, partial [Rhodothermales bacterium]|nr:succinic semialdehyde dehydrogenase [Rhodothermales bacterium]